MANQSNTQAMIQSLLGAQTQGQQVSGEQANNGNPGTIYNQPAAGGQPVVPGAPAQPGAGTSPFGAWVASPGTVLAPGAPIDPYGAIRQTGLQSQPNSTLDDILNRIRSGNFGITPNPSAPGPGTGGPTPGPGNPNPTPGPGLGDGIPINDQIGPISGPIANNPWDFQGNFNNAQPNTNLTESGLGRTAALDWLRLGFQGGNTNRAWNGVIGQDLPAPNTEQGQGFWSGMWGNLRDMASNAISEGLGDTGQWQQLLDIVSEPFIAGDWYNSETGEWNNPLEASGITDLVGSVRSQLSDEQQQALLNQSLNTAQGNMNSQRDAIIRGIMSRFSGQLSPEESRRRAEEIYNSAPEMSASEWRRTQESFDWNNFWNSQGQGTTRNSVTGLPAQDLIDDMINGLMNRAYERTVQMRDRWTRER